MIISFVNPDGGAGKTTLTASIAGLLAKQYKKVLLIDNSPKKSLTRLFMRDQEFSSSSSLYDTISHNGELHIYSTDNKNIDIVPGHIYLEDISGEIYNQLLKSKLEEVRNQYDYILIDCYNNGTLVKMSICASDSIFIVTKPSRDSLQGAKESIELIQELSRHYNYNIPKINILLNQVEDSNVSYRVEGELMNNTTFSQYYNNELNIPRNASVNSLQYQHKTIGVYREYIPAAKSINKIVNQLLLNI